MLRVFTAFSGYDSQCMALDRIGIDYDLVGWSEIDKFAIRAHDAVYPQYADRNFGDIAEIDPDALPDFDLMTYSSPCQDFSIAGRQRGGEKGSGTRSSLLWYCEEIIRVKRPRFLVMENVKNLVSEKFRPLFLEWERTLSGMGYTNFTEVLNAKDYGVPQNRERVFCVSVLDGWYEFPHREVLRKCLRDVLEEEVAEKYFLSEKLLAGFMRHNEKHLAKGTGFIFRPKQPADCANALRAVPALAATDNVVIVQRPRGFNKGGIHEIAPAVSSNSYERNNAVLQAGVTKESRHGSMSYRVYDSLGVCPTLDTCKGGSHTPKILDEDYLLRRLTPRECFRLMGVSEQDIDAIQAAGISDSQQYKMAGNSIVVDVLAKIFQQLFRFNEL